MKLKESDFISHKSPEWKKAISNKDGGVYLITTPEFFEKGIAKIGIAESFEHRMKSWRACYGWFSPLYILGLVITTPEKARQLEKKLLKEFKDRRIPYTYTGKSSEWVELSNPLDIKTKFEEFRGQKGVKDVIVKFDTISSAPVPDLDLTSVKKKRGTKYIIEFPDGISVEASLSLLKKTVDIPPLKDWKPSLKGYQKEYDEIIVDLARTKTAKEIKEHGDIGDMALYVLEERIKQRQDKEAERRHKARLKKIGK